MRGSSGITRDLLVSQGTQPIGPIPPSLLIHTDAKGEIDIENLVTLKVSDFDQVFKLYKIGCRDRATASTNSNSASRADHTGQPWVIGCEVSYKAEFMPEEKDAYRLVVQKPRKMKPADELMCLYM
ncbi:hypothetical protein Bca4012_027724 [Brassica carinata]